MACGATLKRSHEFDSLHSPGRSPKRICGDLISSPKPQCPNYSHPQAFVEAAHKLANGKMNAFFFIIIIINNKYPEAGLTASISVQDIYCIHELQQELY